MIESWTSQSHICRIRCVVFPRGLGPVYPQPHQRVIRFPGGCIVTTEASVDALAKVQKAAVKKLVRHRWLPYPLQKFRFLLFQGPLRRMFVRFYQRRSKTKPIALHGPSIFPDLDVERTLEELRTSGFSEAFHLGGDLIHSLQEFVAASGSNHFYEVHGRCHSFEQIAYDPKIIEVARR